MENNLKNMQLIADRRPMLSTLFVRFLDLDSASRRADNVFVGQATTEELDLITQINQAASEGRVGELEAIIRGSPNIEDIVHLAYRLWHTSTLYCACLGGNVRCARLLLANKHDALFGNWFGTSPLVIATMRNHAEIVFDLLTIGKAELSEEAVRTAAQWKAQQSLVAMYCSGKLTGELINVAWDTAKVKQHVEILETLAKMRETSVVEFAAEMMNVSALKLLSEQKLNPAAANANPTLNEWRKAFIALNRTKVKLSRPTKDFKECKDAILNGQKRVTDVLKMICRMRADCKDGKKKELLALKASRAFRLIAEFLGIVERDFKLDISLPKEIVSDSNPDHVHESFGKMKLDS